MTDDRDDAYAQAMAELERDRKNYGDVLSAEQWEELGRLRAKYYASVSPDERRHDRLCHLTARGTRGPSPRRDFSPTTKRDERPTDVYLLYDEDGALLYVGISLTVAQRMGQHRGSKSWWSDVRRIEVDHFPNRAEALEAEAELIDEWRPPHNHTGGAK